MTKVPQNQIILIGIVTLLLLVTALFAGCTGSTQQAQTTPVATVTVTTPIETPAPVTTTAPVSPPAAGVTTSTPVPVYTYSEGNVVAYTAASLKGVSPKLAEGFAKMYPGHTVVFNLDGTQALTTQVENGAYADVFISASPKYTTELTKGGYFSDGTVKPRTRK